MTQLYNSWGFNIVYFLNIKQKEKITMRLYNMEYVQYVSMSDQFIFKHHKKNFKKKSEKQY